METRSDERKDANNCGSGFFRVKQVVKANEKKPDESGGTKINPERRLPTETLGVEIVQSVIKVVTYMVAFISL